MAPYCPELPIWPKIKNPRAEELSVISIVKIVSILIPIPDNLQVASSKTLTSTCLNIYRGKGSESRLNCPKWINESHTDYMTVIIRNELSSTCRNGKFQTHNYSGDNMKL